MIVVDTSVWSRALRRRPGATVDPAARLLARLIEDHEQLGIPGIVYQEILSGVRDSSQFQRLRGALDPFEILVATKDEHLLASGIANRCRARGVATSTPDSLIAAIAAHRGATLLTADRDFVRMAECSPFRVQFVPDEVSGST